AGHARVRVGHYASRRLVTREHESEVFYFIEDEFRSFSSDDSSSETNPVPLHGFEEKPRTSHGTYSVGVEESGFTTHSLRRLRLMRRAAAAAPLAMSYRWHCAE